MTVRKRLKRLRRLSPNERQILFRAAAVTLAARCALAALPLGKTKCLLKAFVASKKSISLEDAVWSVRAAGRYIPGATCLSQALALQAMLADSGLEASVQIGVRRAPHAEFKAHAWVSFQGEIVLGGPDVSDYVHLTVLES
jgi:hypothetical protein